MALSLFALGCFGVGLFIGLSLGGCVGCSGRVGGLLGHGLYNVNLWPVISIKMLLAEVLVVQ